MLGRVDRLTERTRTGQWAEIAFIAVSDEHLRWWLNHGAGQQEGWQFEVHFCTTSQRGCRQSHRGRGMDFHTDRFRVVTIADLSEKKIDWLKASASKKDVEEELKRLSNLPTGKDGEQGEKGGEGLPFADGGLPPPVSLPKEIPLFRVLHSLRRSWVRTNVPVRGKAREKKLGPLRGRIAKKGPTRRRRRRRPRRRKGEKVKERPPTGEQRAHRRPLVREVGSASRSGPWRR